MELIESFILGKKDLENCEDNIFLGSNYAAIIDGATSSGHIKIENKKGGKFLSDKIKEILEKIDDEKLESSNLIDRINQEIIKSYEDNFINHKIKSSLPSASAVIYNSFYREIIFVGDCQALLIKNNGEIITSSGDRKVDEFNSAIRSKLIKMHQFKNKLEIKTEEEDIGKKYIKELIQLQTIYENTVGHEFSYSTLNGFTKSIKIKKVESDVEYLVLSSDGYPILKPTLKETEEELKQLLIDDPLMIEKHMSTKGFYGDGNSFDDRAYLKIKL